MKDFIEGIATGLKERFQNKFVFTFFLFYCAFNWDKCLALFYLGSFKYSEAVSVLKLEDGVFYFLIFKSFVFALIYTTVSPYVGLFVHWAQSKAVKHYKLIVIKIEKDIEEEKMKLNVLVNENIKKHQENINIQNRNLDKEAFDRLKGSYSEQELIRIINMLNSWNYRKEYENLERLKNHIIDANVIDNEFKTESLRMVHQDAVLKLNSLVDLIESYKDVIFDDSQSDKIPDLKNEIEKIKDDVLAAYRKFRNYKFDNA